MNVTPTLRQITEYSFTLSQADLDAYMADPWAWRDAVQEQLGLNGSAAAAKPPRQKPTQAQQITIGKAARNGHRPNARAGARKVPMTRAAGSSTEKIQCELCPRKIARKFMPKHLATKHGKASEPQAAAAAAE